MIKWCDEMVMCLPHPQITGQDAKLVLHEHKMKNNILTNGN